MERSEIRAFAAAEGPRMRLFIPQGFGPQAGAAVQYARSAPGLRFASSGRRCVGRTAAQLTSIFATFLDAAATKGARSNHLASARGRLPETHRRAEAGAAPAGGLVTCLRATSGYYDPTSVERPRWS